MIPNEKLHHAYLFLGEKNSTISELEKEISEKFGVKLHNNQDFFKKDYDSVGIDEAREIKELQGKMPSKEGSLKVFILSMRSITREAQNALLKVFEEPTKNTHFFLVTPNLAGLLPTLTSRLEIVEIKSETKKVSILPFDLNTFMKGSISTRLKLVEDIIENKEKQKIEALIDEIILKSSSDKKTGNSKILSEMLMVKKFLNFKSSSVKNIAEHLCFVVPRY